MVGSLSLGLGLTGVATLYKGGGYPEGTIYVSKTATNGFAAGSDSNTLEQATAVDRQTPFASVAKAITAALDGDLIVINDGTYTTTELGASSYVVLGSKSLTLQAHRRRQVTFLGTNASYVVRVQSPAASRLFVLRGIVLDADATSQYCLAQNGTDAAHSAQLIDCEFLDPTVRAISPFGADWTYQVNGCDMTGAGSRALFYSNTAADGCSLSISGGSVTITGQASTQGVVEMRATAAGASFLCSGLTIDSTLSASLLSTGTHDGLSVWNVSTVDIRNNDISINGAPAERKSAVIRVTADAAIDVDATVRDNILHNGTTGGYGILIGSDGTTSGDGRCNDPVVSGNTITATPANQTTPVHAIILGFQEGGVVYGNSIAGCGLALIQKHNLTTGALFYANTVQLNRCATVGYVIGLYAKGSVGTTFANNSIYVPDNSSDNAQILHVQSDDAVNTTGAEYSNNAVHVVGSTNIKLVNVGATQGGTFSNNLYYAPAGFATDCFDYQAATYSNIATWQAAEEATAVGGDPKFADAANDDFTLLAGSACIGAGVDVDGVTIDKAGNAYAAPPSIGAFEYVA